MLWLYFCLTIPSLAQVHRYLGWPGVGVYLIVTAGALWKRWALPITERQARWLAGATALAVVAAFLTLYPIAKSGTLGRGSDSDDSLNVAVRAMLHGHYPYDARTYLGNAVHEMPGMLLLATPFVLIGNSAYGNLFWLAMFFAVLAVELKGWRATLVPMWMVLALSPVVMHQLVTGADQMTNGLFVFVLLWCMRRHPLGAVGFGLALSSRANFLLLVPLVFAFLWRQRRVRDIAIVAATFLVVTLPLYWHVGFTPMEGMNRLTRLGDAGLIVGVAAVALTIWLAWRGTPLFAACAISQAFVVVVPMILARDLDFAGYGTFFMFFGIAAVLFEEAREAAGPSEHAAREHA